MRERHDDLGKIGAAALGERGHERHEASAAALIAVTVARSAVGVARAKPVQLGIVADAFAAHRSADAEEGAFHGIAIGGVRRIGRRLIGEP